MPIPTQITFGDDKEKKEKVYNFAHGKKIDLTPEAIEQVQNFTKKNADKTKGKFFRVCVEGGGCSGLQYVFTFDEKKDDDSVIPCGDIKVLLDTVTEPYVKGSVVDYINELTGAGFIVKNPQSKGECGCGISFAV